MTNYVDADQERNIKGMFTGLAIVVLAVIFGGMFASWGLSPFSFIPLFIVLGIGSFVALWYSWAYRRWFDNTSAEDF